MPFSLTWLPGVLRAAGLKVAEQPGWADHGRGEMGAVRGVMCHHTATARDGNMPSLGTLTRGRRNKDGTILRGPLSQLGLGRDGTYYVIAAGRANHAGDGVWNGSRTGNSSFIAIEAENSGNEAWPEVQMDAYVRGVAAILKQVSASADMCCGHKEYALPAGRKPDPNFDMNAFRAQVRAAMTGTAVLRPIIPAAAPDGKATLRRGARGEAVKIVQRAVGVAEDGIFGAVTEAAVRRFQRANALVPDGIVGPKTWAVIGG